MSEIKPCPRCGSKAFVTIQFGVMCEVDRCLHLPPRENREQAIAAWNTRASDACASVQKERDELREMLGEAVGVLRQSSSALSASYQQAQCEWTNRDKAADRHDRTVIDFRNAVSTFLARYEGGRS